MTKFAGYREGAHERGRQHGPGRWLASTTAAGAIVTAMLVAMLVPSLPVSASGGLSMTGYSPPSGPVGTKVTIDGTGFSARDMVQFNGTPATVSSVNKGGTKLETSVPPLATTGTITVGDPTTGQTVGLPNSPFSVTRGIFAAPNRVWAGGSFTLEGSGLSSDHTDSVDIGTKRIAQVRVGADGNFKVGVSVPWDEPSGIARLSVDDFAGSVITILYILGSWPMYRHDPQHTGVDTYETSLSVNTVQALKQLWMKVTDPSGTFAMIPSVANGLVYEGANESGNTSLYAFTTDGTKMPWQAGYLYSSLETEPDVLNGTLYASAAGSISPLDVSLGAASGTQHWADGLSIVSTASPSAPNVVAGTMYVGAPDGNVYAIDAATGTVKWSFQTGGAVQSSPAYYNGILYVGSDSGYVYAIQAATGKKDWSYGSLGVIDSSPAVVGGVVYVGSENDYKGSVIALDASSGAVVWHDTFQGVSFPTSPAVTNGVVYIGGSTGQTGYMYALNASTGVSEWHVTSGPDVTDPAYANGVVYYSVDGSSTSGLSQVRAIDASNGNVLWHTYSVTDPLAPIISNGIVYVEGQNAIFAFSL